MSTPEPATALTSWWQQPTREAFQSAFQANAERILREGQKNSKVLITAADSRGRVKFSERTIDEFV